MKSSATAILFVSLLAFLATVIGCDESSDPLNPNSGVGTEFSPDAAGGGSGDTGSDASVPSQSDGGTDTSLEDTPPPHISGPADLAPRRWAPVPQPSVTHDVDRDLLAVLERENLERACGAYFGGQTDRTTMLRCGKWMFFYGTFGTVGIPQLLLEFLQRHYADSYYGEGFSAFGFVPDPYDDTGMPIGLADTTGQFGSLDTKAFTCASCHFGQLPDGRYAVGYGSLNLDYGRFLTSLGAPLSLSMNANDPNVHPRLREELAEPVRLAKSNSSYMIELALTGIRLSTEGDGDGLILSLEEQEKFLDLRPGTMDFTTPPLVDDGVWTVSRIMSLWNLPDAAQREAAGMAHEMLSWNGGAHSVENFLVGFVAIGVSEEDEWTVEKLRPLEEYIRSLRTPALESELDAEAIEQGAAHFVTSGCMDCHVGPSGESSRAYDFDEIGTDSAMRNIFNPTEIPGGEPCCGMDGDGYDVTGGVKAPRLTGLETQTKYLHNGSVNSLEELFCLHPRDPTTIYAQTSAGHTYGCETLSEAQRRALIEYMLSL